MRLQLLLVTGAPGAEDLFVRGDADADARVLASDALAILGFLFHGESDAVRCLDAADVDDDGGVSLSDAVYLLNALFRGTAPPPAPFPFCGPDPTADGLSCEFRGRCLTPFEFAGREIAADGVFFLLDRSRSMQDSGELHLAKRAIIETLSETWSIPQLGVIIFDANLLTFPADGRPADGREAAVRGTAIRFVNAAPGESGTCVLKGLLAALDLVSRSTAGRNVIIYVGDGGGTCGGNESNYHTLTLQEATAANNGRAEIHAFGVLMAGRTAQEQFLRALAAANGGTYSDLN
jgi:hypothetical protein